MIIRAITLHQPYASLIASGRKPRETRSWPAPAGLVGHDLAIHAAEKWHKEYDEVATAAGYSKPKWSLPYGAVVAVVKVVACVKTEELGDPSKLVDYEWGDFTPGRWAWCFDDVRPCTPYHTVGRQGIWTLPEEVVQILAGELGEALRG